MAHPLHHNPKRNAQVAEAAVWCKAKPLCFHVANPRGNGERNDFIAGNGSRLWRVQLKCTEVLRARGYDVQPIYSVYGKGKVTYTDDDIDFLVDHILPVDVCYILPIAAIEQSTSLRFYPDIPCKCARWEQYREAWHLFL